MDAAARTSEFIGREQLLSPGQRIVLGVSGGADSLCLLGCLHQLGYRIVVAHLDHGWRSSSWADAMYVLVLARELGLPAVVERLPMIPAGRAASLEERGREARYEFLARIAHQHRAEAVAVGHTADDQAETVVMHWLRGAGPNGLRGILPATHLPRAGKAAGSPVRLVRPLLDLRRFDTEEFCRQRGWEPRHDESNQDPTFLRNRIRAGLLPDLESAYPGFSERVVRSAQLMREVSEWIDHHAAAREPDLVHVAGLSALRVDRRALGLEPRVVQREIVRRALRRLRPDLRDIGFETVEALLEMPTDASPRSLIGDIRALRFDQDWILVGRGGAAEFPEYPQLRDPAAVILNVPGAVRLEAGWSLVARKRRPRGRETLARIFPRGVVLDAARLAAPLEVRGPRPGDRIRPLGMKGRIKVSDLLSQEHIPGLLRPHWPLVVSGAEVVWVAGVRMAEDVKVGRRTRAATVLSLQPPGGENGWPADFTRRARLQE